MGSTLSVEETLRLIVNDLEVEQTHVHCWRSNNIIKSVCLVEEKWIQALHDGVHTKPQSYPGTCYETFLLLQPSNEAVPKPWTRVSLKILRKPLIKARKPNGIRDDQFPANDSFVDLMSYVSTENFKSYLLQSSKKYSKTPVFGDTKTDVVSAEDVIIYLAKHVYNLEIVKLNGTAFEEKSQTDCGSSLEQDQLLPENTPELSDQRFSDLVPVYGVLESDNAYFIVEPFMPHSLQDVVWFSPSVLSSTIAKPLFLLYQILKLFETFHRLNYYCAVNNINDIFMHKSLWLFMSATDVNLGEIIPAEDPATGSSCPVSESALSYAKVGSFEIPIPIQVHNLPALTELWVKKEISNFDYLMALNMFAGRRLGDPNYHPVLPWVTDFTRAKGNFRDLTKSKFRINKGDHQLELTYQGAQLSDQDGDLAENSPHHVSGVLSEITYHVYLARRTAKSVLQKHVRAKWEPNEYPANMQRLQEWTPDECIPEFYADPTIFKSIHSDLPDLDVPPWALSPDDFVRLHREALESEYVCNQLNHWIDLTFGYKLMGAAAVKAKNVYLHLVDNHEGITNHGVLQLFQEPHPCQHRHHEMVLYPSMVNFEDGLEYDMSYVSKQDEELLRTFGTVEELAVITGKEGLPSSSWDNVDVGTKLETGEDELGASVIVKKQKWGRANLSAFLRLKDSVEATDVPPTIDSLPISLPIGYDPLEEFDQVQLLTKFKMQSKQHDLAFAATLPLYEKGNVLPRSDIPETARYQEIQNLCSMLMEMFLPVKMRLLSSNLSPKEKFIAAKRVFTAGQGAITGVLRDGIKILFDEGCGFHKRQGLSPLTPELLLQPLANIFPFPSYFKRLRDFLTEFHRAPPNVAAGFSPETSWARMRISNQGTYSLRQVEIAVKHLPELLSDLNEEGVDLLMTYLNPLFCHEETQLQSFLQLFDPLATRLGPKKARKVFLKLLLKQYDVRMSESSVPLFHQSFISKLIMRFGLEQFLSHFITFIVDALNLSTKDVHVNVDTCSQDEVHGVILEDEKEPEKETAVETKLEAGESARKQDEEDVTSTNSEIASMDLAPNGEGQEGLEGHEGMLGVSDRNSNDSTEPSGSHPPGAAEVDGVPASFISENKAVASDEELEDEEETVERCQVNNASRSLMQNTADDWYNDESVAPDFNLERSVSFMSDNLECHDEEEGAMTESDEVHSKVDISEAAAESLCWLAPPLGPLLTSNFIIKPLLQMLIKCYIGVVSMGDRGALVGDENAKWILHCLRRFTEIYGEAIIIHQYLPFITSKINSVSEHVSVKNEANLAGALILVRHCVLSVSKSSLLQQFELICNQFLNQVLCLLSSGSISFASGAPARIFLAYLIVEVLKLACDILERDSAQELLSSLIQPFFSSFDKAFSVLVPPSCSGSPSAQEPTLEIKPCSKEIQDTFTASLAYHAYITLCKSLGDTYMEATLYNYEMIWLLCCSMDKGLSNHTPPMTSQPKFVLSDEEPEVTAVTSDAYSGLAANKRMAEISLERSSNSTSVEMKKDTSLGHLEQSANMTSNKSSFVSSRQHLTGNWLKYWKNHLGKRNQIDRESFSQLKLQTFTGHMDGIKDLYVQDSEHLFLSASKDKTVKLWSLSNHGDGTGQSASSWTAYEHRRPVFAIDVIDVMRQAVSCDGSVHIWDLATGSSVVRHNLTKSNPAVAMTTLPSPSSCVVVAMQNSDVRFIDARKDGFVHTWKVTSNNLAGMIRSMCVNREGTWLAVGFSGGSLSLVDLRGGILSRQWKAHETDVIQVKPYTNSSLITLSATQKMDLWNVDHDGTLISLPTGVTTGESIQNICVHDKVIISSTLNNRIGWHTFNDKEPTYSSIRLRNDVFKGNLTCFGVLPLNRGYLFGSDNGNITLMA